MQKIERWEKVQGKKFYKQSVIQFSFNNKTFTIKFKHEARENSNYGKAFKWKAFAESIFNGAHIFLLKAEDEEEFAGCKADQQDLDHFKICWPRTAPGQNSSIPCPVALVGFNQGNLMMNF